jgi:hypothetical protein
MDCITSVGSAKSVISWIAFVKTLLKILLYLLQNLFKFATFYPCLPLVGFLLSMFSTIGDKKMDAGKGKMCFTN